MQSGVSVCGALRFSMADELVLAPERRVAWGEILRRGLRRAVGFFPFSVGGVVLVVLLLAVWFSEVSKHANQVLFALTLCLGGCIAVFLLFVVLSAVWVGIATWRKNRNNVAAGTFDAESEIWTGFRIFRPFIMPLVDFEITWSDPESMRCRWEGRGFWQDEVIEPQSRGEYRSLMRCMRISDIFGLCAVSVYWVQEAALVIKPAPALMGEFSVLDESSGEGYSHPKGEARGELVDMRRYQAGDPLRLVLWRVFARNRELLVRAPERAIVEQRDIFVYFVAGQGDDATASLARDFLEKNSDVGDNFVFGADGAKRLVHSKEEGMEDVIHSSEHRQEGAQDLLKLAQAVPREVLGHCYIMVPSYRGRWLNQVQDFVTHLGVRPVFLLGLSRGFEKDLGVERGRMSRILFSHRESSERLKAFGEVYAKLEALGEVRVFFPKSGVQLSRDEIEALRNL